MVCVVVAVVVVCSVLFSSLGRGDSQEDGTYSERRNIRLILTETKGEDDGPESEATELMIHGRDSGTEHEGRRGGAGRKR